MAEDKKQNERKDAMPKFRKKPVVIEAIQWDGSQDSSLEVLRFCSGYSSHWKNGVIVIDTPKGKMNASIGDWIIRGVKGELYSCKPNIFKATYEPVDAGPRPVDTGPTYEDMIGHAQAYRNCGGSTVAD